jgi:hypothetical protein
MKISKIPKDKETLQMYHKMLWGNIYKYVKENEFKISIRKLKYKIVAKLFDGDLKKTLHCSNNCFGCIPYNECLFACDCYFLHCLNGLWEKLCDLMNEQDLEETLKTIKQIRDFPIRKDK